MNTQTTHLMSVPALLMALALPGAAQATPYLDGTVAYDYYVAGVDGDGFEFVDADLYAEAVVNDSSARSGPLALSGWLTRNPDASGAGVEAGYLPVGYLPGYGEAEVSDSVPADDVRPGEYFVHMLLQDERYPGTYEDSRELPPTLLWRGGLQAVGPLHLYQYEDGRLDVDFERLDNRRLDGRYTNPIILTLFATYGFGPASEGLVLCEQRVAGLYAGDSRFSPGFSCYPSSLPDGEYSLHLEVAEAGGRGGYSTLTGPDADVRGGWLGGFHGCNGCYAAPPVYVGHDVYYAGSLGSWLLLPLMLAGLRRARVALAGALAVALVVPGMASATPRDADYSDAELDQLLAPIALYPDSVLSNVLIAATYPLEVAQAARFVRQHPDLEGDAALEAVEDRDWDDSVKSLVAVPEILERMDEDLEWTRDLGEAFLAQDGQVMDRIQFLRHEADDEGYLDKAEHVEVVREREVIYIEPVVARRVYVPYYDPWVVYGTWWWPLYPPHHWTYWGGYPVSYYTRFPSPFYWSPVFYVSSGFYFSAFNWHHHHVVVVPRHRYTTYAYRGRDIARHGHATRWNHNPERRHVEYRHARLSHQSDTQRTRRNEAVERERRRSQAAQQPKPRHSRPAADRGERRDRAQAPGRARESGSVSNRQQPSRSNASPRSESSAPRQRQDDMHPGSAEPRARQRAAGPDARRHAVKPDRPAPRSERRDESPSVERKPSDDAGERRASRGGDERGSTPDRSRRAPDESQRRSSRSRGGGRSGR